MKVPKIFVPEKDLTGKIKEYVKGNIVERVNQLHEDPNLCYVISLVIISSRISTPRKLTLAEVVKLASGETSRDFKRKGIPTKDIVRTIQKLTEISESKGGKCLFAGDFFKALELVLPEYVNNKDLEVLKESYFEKIGMDIVQAVTDIASRGSVVYRTLKEDDEELYNKVVKKMGKSGYCKTCAEKTLEYFCTRRG